MWQNSLPPVSENSPLIKKILSNSAIYGLAPQIPQVANIFILPLITQDLTRLDYGVAGIIYSYLAALAAIHLLGTKMILSNSYFHHAMQHKWLWRQMHGFISLWSLLYGVLVGLVIFFAVPEEAIENRGLIVLLHVIPSAFLNVTIEYGTIYYQVSQKPVPIGIQVVSVGLVSVFLNLYLISFLKMGYMGWFWSRFVASILSFCFFFYTLYFRQKFIPIFNFKWRLIKEKLKLCLPLIPYYYGSYLLTSSDRIVMDQLKVNVNKIGVYNLGANFGNYFNSFADGSGLAINPIIYQYLQKLPREKSFKLNRDLTFLWQAAMMVLSFVVCLWFKEIFELLIQNDDLQAAYPLAIIMIMGCNYRPLYSGFAVKLFYFEKSNSIWKISFGAGLLNIVLNIIFIPIYGIEAAAISTFVAFLAMGIAGFFISDYRKMDDLKYYPFYWLVGICIATVVVYMLKDIYWVSKVGITLGILGASAFWAFRNKAFLLSFDLKNHSTQGPAPQEKSDTETKTND